MDRLFECSICQMTYDDNSRKPRLLPKCLHSFCSQCILKLYQGRNWHECPICRAINNVPFSNLPVNRDILQFYEAYQSNLSNQKNQPTPKPEWNEDKFLKELFDEIDYNRDGKINCQELHQALKKGQLNSEFDFRTAVILMEKYDSNRDGEISLDEFYNLFLSINDLFNQFLDHDEDFSQSIEPNELKSLLSSKGYHLTDNFFEFLFRQLQIKNNIVAITFDIYVRISARLDYLTNIGPKNQQEFFEQYLIQHFFENF